MISYIFRRLFLMLPVFVGTTFLVFIIISYVPGGPFEKAVMQLKQVQFGAEENALSLKNSSGASLSPEVLAGLKRQYGLDKPLVVRYLIWLGVWPRTVREKTISREGVFREDLRYVEKGEDLYSVQRWIRIQKKDNTWLAEESGVGADIRFNDVYPELPEAADIIDWQVSRSWRVKSADEKGIQLVKEEFSGILTGDLGISYVYDEPVTRLIRDRLHISCYFGILGFILSYMVCIPLGIAKAVRHGSFFDWTTSVLVFVAYSIPGYFLGALLLVFFGGGSFWDVFPLGGFVSEGFESLNFQAKCLDLLHHTFLPVLCYTIGSFATVTVLMKNSLLENLSQDYVRTAIAKGLSQRRVIFVHALRNSLIPISTGMGSIIGIFLAGSYMIEKVFNIDGIGMLSYVSIMSADYPVVLGFLVLNTLILLIGNLLSDLLYALIDPRIKF